MQKHFAAVATPRVELAVQRAMQGDAPSAASYLYPDVFVMVKMHSFRFVQGVFDRCYGRQQKVIIIITTHCCESAHRLPIRPFARPYLGPPMPSGEEKEKENHPLAEILDTPPLPLHSLTPPE